jgi:UDP:flavonoid glycosyltransferase YjiC (YdhE family)
MSRFLVYTSPAHGHVLPLVPGLVELAARGHDVHVRTLPELVDSLVALGLEASPVAPRVAGIPVTDFQAATDAARLKDGQVDLIARGHHDGPDLEAAIASFRPDALLVDAIAYGAMTAAERSGLPSAMVLPSVLPWPGRGVPPYGLGLRPMSGPLGRVRDAVLLKVVERMFGKAMLPGLNELRRAAGLPAHRSPLDLYHSLDAVISLTAEPLEYPRTDLPGHMHFVGVTPGTRRRPGPPTSTSPVTPGCW